MPTRDEQLDIRITTALEAQPTVAVPADFAARIIQRVPQQRIPVRIRQPHTGRRIATVSIALLALLLIAVMFAAPQTGFVAYALEPLLTLQLGALVYWQFTQRISAR